MFRKREDSDRSTLLRYPAGKLEWDYTVPDNVISIGKCAFDNCSHLKSISIPDGVKSIEHRSFEHCSSLESITLPAGAKFGINENQWAEVFCYCSSLTEIHINGEHELLTEIDGVLFSKDKTILIRFPEGREGTYEIPEGTVVIGQCAFVNANNLEKVIIPDTVTELRRGAFGKTGLKELTIPDSVTKIEQDAVNVGYGKEITVKYNGKEYTNDTLKKLQRG